MKVTAAGPRQPCDDAPGSEVSRRNKVVEHCLFQLDFCQKISQPGVLLLQLNQPASLLGLHASVLLAPTVVGGCVTSITQQTSATVLPWAISCSAVVSLRIICSAVYLIRFMVKSTAQSGGRGLSFTLNRFPGSRSESLS